MCVAYAEFRINDIRWTAGLCALSACFCWWAASVVFSSA